MCHDFDFADPSVLLASTCSLPGSLPSLENELLATSPPPYFPTSTIQFQCSDCLWSVWSRESTSLPSAQMPIRQGDLDLCPSGINESYIYIELMFLQLRQAYLYTSTEEPWPIDPRCLLNQALHYNIRCNNSRERTPAVPFSMTRASIVS